MRVIIIIMIIIREIERDMSENQTAEHKDTAHCWEKDNIN